jgi:cobalt-zinc-cadmium efflux system membrane fusion protein
VAAKLWKVGAGLALAAVAVVAAGSATWIAGSSPAPGTDSAAAPSSAPENGEKIRRDGRGAIVVPAAVAERMGLKTTPAAEPTRPLTLPAFQGTLAPDPERAARVHSRFPGEVVSVEPPADPKLPTARPVRVGDRVRQGDVLAVVWSKDLGEKKSELVDALARLRADETTVRRLEEAVKEVPGAIAGRTLLEARAKVEADRVAADRAERTLRVWRLTDKEIDAVRAEVDRLSDPKARGEAPADWARVEVPATRDGVILVKNAAPGDIVDTTADLFVIGDLSRLAVWAHVYEEDLPLVQALPRPVKWSVEVLSRPGTKLPGTLEHISPVIDTNQHTALITGLVDNPAGELIVGQSVTVTVELPPPGGEVVLPADAVFEDGRQSAVFIQPNTGTWRLVRVPIRVTRRFRDAVYVKAEENGVRRGTLVVTAGALLLRDVMNALPAQP